MEEKKYPKIIAGAFIFNDHGELLLVKAPRWQNKYNRIGGKVELGESIADALAREIKEETNLEVKDINFLGVLDNINLEGTNDAGYKHLIFLDHTAIAVNPAQIKLDEEGEDYKWLALDEWLKKDEKAFAPSVYAQLEKIKEVRVKGKGDFEQKYKRALADYQNLAKQAAREKDDFRRFANEQFLQDILPVYDNLKMAAAHYKDGNNRDSWLEGVKHIVNQFSGVLSTNGVEEIKTVGEEFDHCIMEAVESELTADKEKDAKVAREIKPGYKLNGKVILPARVVVYKFEK